MMKGGICTRGANVGASSRQPSRLNARHAAYGAVRELLTAPSDPPPAARARPTAATADAHRPDRTRAAPDRPPRARPRTAGPGPALRRGAHAAGPRPPPHVRAPRPDHP